MDYRDDWYNFMGSKQQDIVARRAIYEGQINTIVEQPSNVYTLVIAKQDSYHGSRYEGYHIYLILIVLEVLIANCAYVHLRNEA